MVTERILERLPGCEHLAPVASAHHERLDGSGYLRGLPASQLTMPMRLLAVADVHEALTSPRPYRRARTSDDALAIMRTDVPARLDGEAFAALERLLAEKPTHRRGCTGASTSTTPRPCWTPSRARSLWLVVQQSRARPARNLKRRAFESCRPYGKAVSAPPE
jgi:hypothetical protein